MALTLLDTKVFVPRLRASTVSRPRLAERLDRALESRLTLVSGPPGFGKTTLLTDWLASRAGGESVAWLSLDDGDNDPVVFWAYVIAALERAAPGVGDLTKGLLESGQVPSIQGFVATLLNELNTVERDLLLVLDDYHVVHAVEIHEAMAFLLDHLPSRVHVVIASRADPPLPLARLRARGELVEVRTADLRFLPAEAEAYLNDEMRLALSPTDLGVLEERSEGWIAALHLAALSLQGRGDVAGFIDGFAGDNRYVLDYLVEEVLQKQTEPVRDFLLQTSILDRLGGDLCRAVTGLEDSQALLRRLEDENVFVVPLDERRQWFRYHHLFADVLRARLTSEAPERLPGLHTQASRWFEQNGELAPAIRHAMAAGNFDRMAGLVELALPVMLRSRQDATLRAWLDALPADVLKLRPVLATGYVSLLLHHGQLASVEGRLSDAEAALGTATRTEIEPAEGTRGPAYVDDAQFRELPGMIALYRAGYSQVTGNLLDTQKYARRALELMPPDAPLRGGAMALLGLALWSNGELEPAYRTYAEGIARVHQGGYVNDSSTIMLADIRVAQGRLREALSAYAMALQRAGELGTAAPRGAADLHVGISEIYTEQGNLDAALEHLAKSSQPGEAAGLPENRYRWFTAMAEVKGAAGAFDDALELLDQAERLYAGGFSPDLRPIAAMRARVWIAQGRLVEADAWARDRGLTPGDEISYLREFELVTLARLLLARHPQVAGLTDAVQLLDRLLACAEAGGRTGTVIEVLVLLALARMRRGDRASAHTSLKRAVAVAEPEGYVRVFVDEGPEVASLLDEIARGADPGYARVLLAGFEGRAGGSAKGEVDGPDSLSERELDVVRLLEGDLSGPDIARELVVSLNTVRTHTKSIYTKLGVNSRRAAVRRARELHLL